MRKTPFFSRFVESQRSLAIHTDLRAGKPVLVTLKYPSDNDEAMTMKYPSDDDEVVKY